MNDTALTVRPLPIKSRLGPSGACRQRTGALHQHLARVGQVVEGVHGARCSGESFGAREKNPVERASMWTRVLGLNASAIWSVL